MRPHPEGYLVKLVRDRVPAWLGGGGETTYRPVPDDELRRLLRAKLIEEAVEYALEPSIDELAQVLELVTALANVDLGVGLVDVDAERQRQWDERGGFTEGMGMYATHPVDHA